MRYRSKDITRVDTSKTLQTLYSVYMRKLLALHMQIRFFYDIAEIIIVSYIIYDV